MRIRLCLLDGVTWEGRPLPGNRTAALLAALADEPGGLSYEGLAARVWDADPPENPVKSLQVLVSRVRAATVPELVVAQPGGYRLGTGDVDAWVLTGHLRRAGTALAAGNATVAVAEAEAARRIGVGEGGGPDPVARLRAAAALAHARAGDVLGRALARCGEYARALPLVEAAHARNPDDAHTFGDLLRSLAATSGPAAALSAYEAYRADLADRLGTDPAPELRALHGELLARDRPVRQGLRHDATELIGRADDVTALVAHLHSARVTSIVGAGGLGKTRLAHLLGRHADEPVVYFVELVAVSSPDDVVDEVGSVLGVRDSLATRRGMTARQRADIRYRVAEHLGRAPTLLILDNCEHVVDAVADLVAFLVTTVRQLRVLTTSRAPLRIAAERVYPLGQLTDDDAVELFCQRARAARADVRLPPDVVLDVVRRLDGLPLALELAAVKVRAMSVAELGLRLADRFALLRGGDRGAPDRHQTLLAVIDWSWNLLDDRDKRALRRLAVCHDGFGLAAAEAVVGPDALDAVAELANQSLLVVAETEAGVRYRMLETVREFGMLRLADAGEEADARAAQRRWARSYARAHAGRLYGRDQVEAMAMVRTEEHSLADVLRQALAEADQETVVELFTALGSYWSICGEHDRAMALIGPITRVLAGWRPPPELTDQARLTLCLALLSAVFLDKTERESLRSLLAAVGVESDSPMIRAMAIVVLALSEAGDPQTRLAGLAGDPSPSVAQMALRWLVHERENAGNPRAAIEAGERALTMVDEADGPWSTAQMHTQLAMLYVQVGRDDQAEAHARAALPDLTALGAVDDATSVRAVIAMAALSAGRLDEAERIVDELDEDPAKDGFGSLGAVYTCRAQLAIANGDVAEGLRLHRLAAAKLGAVRFREIRTDIQIAPWAVYGDATALAAHAHVGSGDDGADLYLRLAGKARLILSPERRFLDVPVAGLLMFGLGLWGLLRDALEPADAVRLLVLAERFAYQRMGPTMRWERAVAAAERVAPGVLAAIEQEYGDRRGLDLLVEARAVADRLFSSHLAGV